MEQIDPKAQATAYLRQLIADLTATLGPALRGPVVREAEQAMAILAEPTKTPTTKTPKP